MGAGSGGFYLIYQEMRRLRREMDRHLQQRYDRQVAREHRLERGRHAPRPPAELDYPAFQLCGGCGYFAFDAETACPACNETHWYDLSQHAVADALRLMDERRRHSAPLWVRVIYVAGLAVAVGSAFVLWPSIFTVLLCAPLAIAAYWVGLRSVTWGLTYLRPPRPHRWHQPVPPPARASPLADAIRGAATGAALLRAPFSGRECLAFQACILFDTVGDARPPEWVVQEASSTDLQVADQTFRGDQALYRGALQPVPTAGLEPAELERYLRQRGLFLGDGEYQLFEAVLVDGDPVRVTRYRDVPYAIVEAAESDLAVTK